MRKPPPPSGSAAFLFGRHSSDNQNPSSAEDQLRMGAELCARMQWKIVGQAKDEARTGRTMVGRTGVYAVLAAAEADDCDVVVVEDISRIARNVADMMEIARRLTAANVVIYTFAGGVVDGMELAIRASIAEEQSEEIARRVQRGHRSAAMKGRLIGGVAYGYDMLDEPDEHGGLRIINEAEAKVVRRVYEDIAAGVSTYAICHALNREGVQAPKGKIWRPKALTGDKHLQTGIGRNPVYAGKAVFGKSNSKLNTSTGQVKVTPGEESDFIIRDVPHLQIVPEDLWQAVQEILDGRSHLVPNSSRHPPYPLSGLTKCGECGEAFTMVGSGLGCTGRRYGTGCGNGRRVAREDLERAVLEGIVERILEPDVLEIYLTEYRQEVAKAIQEYSARSDSTRANIQKLNREIDNLIDQIKSGASGYAKQRMNEELERLGVQRKEAEREVRRAAPALPPSLETEAVIRRGKAMMQELGAALNGPERDAARARDIIRSMIKEIRVTPIGEADGHGAGPVRVTIEGYFNELLAYAFTDRVIQRRGSTSATLGLPKKVFEYYFDLTRENSETARGVYRDLVVVSRLLDDAEVPVSHAEFVRALNSIGPQATPEQLHQIDLRARCAVTRLKNSKLIRSVKVRSGYAGWVWNQRGLSDEEWRDRYRRELLPAPEPKDGSVDVFAHIGRRPRVTPPEAYVVIIRSEDEVEPEDE